MEQKDAINKPDSSSGRENGKNIPASQKGQATVLAHSPHHHRTGSAECSVSAQGTDGISNQHTKGHVKWTLMVPVQENGCDQKQPIVGGNSQLSIHNQQLRKPDRVQHAKNLRWSNMLREEFGVRILDTLQLYAMLNF